MEGVGQEEGKHESRRRAGRRWIDHVHDRKNGERVSEGEGIEVEKSDSHFIALVPIEQSVAEVVFLFA